MPPSRRSCAYCGSSSRPLTKEEVLPAFLAGLHPRYDKFRSRARPDLVINKSFSVRDVCPKCNNVHLSHLDSYAAGLCRHYFRTPVRPGARGRFEYDFHRFNRWIWKLLYNAARSDGSDVAPFKTMVPYILGEVRTPPLAQTLSVGVIRADVATDRERNALGLRYLYPRCIRIGELETGPFARYTECGHFVGINSYLFPLIQWKASAGRRPRQRIAEFVARVEGTTIMPQKHGIIEVPECGLSVRQYLSSGTRSTEPLYFGRPTPLPEL